MHKILLVEDSKEIYTMVNQAVGSYSDLKWVENIADAQEYLDQNDISLLLLDIELPDGSGIDFCSKLRMENPDLSIFMLTAHSDLSEKVLGFSAGADDYITKPFALLELKARIDSRLSRVEHFKSASDLMKWDVIEIDKGRQEVKVLVSGNFEPLDLTALEFKLLVYFANEPGHVFHRDKVLNDIWGEDVHVYARSVDTHVSKLRRKLGELAPIIESVHGSGYKFNPAAALN